MTLLRLFLLLLTLTTLPCLHLTFTPLHFLATPNLQATIAAAIQNLTTLNDSLTLTLSSLNPYNQQQRISTM